MMPWRDWRGSGSPSSTAAAAASTASRWSRRAACSSALDPDEYEVVPIGITRARRAGCSPRATRRSCRSPGARCPRSRTAPRSSCPADPDRGGTGRRSSPARGVQALETVDVVFPVLHGRFGEDGTIQGLLEMAGVPYVGPGVFASAAAMDKEFTKKLLRAEGLDGRRLRACCAAATRYRRSTCAHLGLPVFVKPARAGSSVGITKVTDWARPAGRARRRVRARRQGADRGRGDRPRGRVRRARGRERRPEASACRPRSGWSASTTGTTSRPSTSTTPASSTSRRELPRRRHRSGARGRLPRVRRARLRRAGPRRLLRHARTSRSSSTRSTRCRASRRSRCSRGCGRRPASTTRAGRPADRHGAAPRAGR